MIEVDTFWYLFGYKIMLLKYVQSIEVVIYDVKTTTSNGQIIKFITHRNVSNFNTYLLNFNLYYFVNLSTLYLD